VEAGVEKACRRLRLGNDAPGKTMRIAALIAFLGVASTCLAEEPMPRKFYGAKLEPVMHVLHGAGQGRVADVRAYRETLKSHDPILFMDYCPPTKDTRSFVRQLREKLADFPAFTGLQLGVGMTKDGDPECHFEHEVAAGKYDDKFTTLFDELTKLGVPCYIRIGYECNGSWNGYRAGPYREAFIRVTRLIRKSGLNAATVWCVHPDKLEQIMPYYPGDEWVDWWAFDPFSLKDMAASRPFLVEADRHGKPVMIGESTPRMIGVLHGQASWDKWFRPYFALIRESPGIKAFCYINWNWARYPRWSKWGDARLQQNELVAERYREEMASPLYLHASTREAFEAAIKPPVSVPP
jgi:hypothetical protein